VPERKSQARFSTAFSGSAAAPAAREVISAWAGLESAVAVSAAAFRPAAEIFLRDRLLAFRRRRRLAFRRPQAILDSQLGDRHMALGTVKWFNSQKGYGFIQPQGGGQDVFVHISAVERAGLSSLNEGQQLEYEIVTDRGKQSAGNLKVK
jgi:cold shock protein